MGSGSLMGSTIRAGGREKYSVSPEVESLIGLDSRGSRVYGGRVQGDRRTKPQRLG